MSPSLADDPLEFKKIVDQLWAKAKGEITYGKGKVYAGVTVAEALALMKIKPDFEYAKR